MSEMPKRTSRFLLLLACVWFADMGPHGYSQEPKDTVGETDRVVLTSSLEPAALISEDEFVRMLGRQKHKAASSKMRREAVGIAAKLNEPSVRGLEGRLVRRPDISHRVLIVARDFQRVGQGGIRATNMYVVALGDTIRPSWAVISPRLLALKDRTPQVLEPGGKDVACAPQPGPHGEPLVLAASTETGAGLPAGIAVNAESAHLPRNGLGNIVELRLFPAARASAPANRFVCAGDWPRNKPSAPTTAPVVPSAEKKTSWAAPKYAVLISEGDYSRLSIGVPKPALAQARPNGLGEDGRRTIRDAAAFVSAANHPGARGLRATLGSATVIDTSLVVVARDWQIEGGQVSASEFYVVFEPIRGPVQQVGLDLMLDFPAGVPLLDLNAGLCGPILVPETGSGCTSGFCTALPTWQSSTGYFGVERFGQGLPRTTLRWSATNAPGTFDMSVIACTQLQPPPPPPPPARCDIDVFTGRPVIELCNGVDDNCNGAIDEGNACAVRQVCPCQPRTCGPGMCGSVPDGCGNIIACRPCP